MNLSTVMQLANNPQVRPLLQSLLQRFGDAGQGRSGGASNLMGLVQHLDTAGLSDQVRSWTGSGPNEQITGLQLTQALGSDTIELIALENDTTPDEAADGLAAVLPRLVDSSTNDDGQFSSHPDINSLLNLLGH